MNWMDATRSKPANGRPVIVRRGNGETRIAAWKPNPSSVNWMCLLSGATFYDVTHWASLPVIMEPNIGGMTRVRALERDDIPAVFLDHYTFERVRGQEPYSLVGTVPTARANAWAKGMAERAGGLPLPEQTTGEQQTGNTMTTYLSAWSHRYSPNSPMNNFNEATEEHPLQLLRERRILDVGEDWVLLWFCEVDPAAFNGYYGRCATENEGEMLGDDGR